MLKPMKPKQTFPNNTILWALVGLLVISGIIALVSAFSGGDNGEDEVNAVYTNAAATLVVQQMTLQASMPSVTPTTFTQTPTATFTPLASPTLFATQAGVASPSNNTGSGAVGCNNSAFVTDVTIPDNTVMTPGQTFTKTWKLQNIGSCPWTTAYKVSFVSGNAMGGVATPLTVTVAPGASGDVSVAMTAPTTPGEAVTGTWILTNDSGQNFGSTFFVLVKVGGTSTSGTATATATTAAATIPTAANNPTITLTCALEGGTGPKLEYTGTLTWEDKSNNETGFNVYINGSLATTTGENITSYSVPAGTFLDPNTPVTYSVEAFNNTGKAALVSVIKQCP